MTQNTSNIYAAIPNILTDLFIKPYTKIGDESTVPTGDTESPIIAPPVTPLAPVVPSATPNINTGGGSSPAERQAIQDSKGPYAYEERFWGGNVPVQLQGEGLSGLWGNVKSGLQSAKSAGGLGIFGQMLGGTNPLSVPMMALSSFAAPTSSGNPLNDPVVRNGLNETYTRVLETNPAMASKYGSTTQEFNKFLDGVFGTGTSWNLSDNIEKSWAQVTPEARQLLDMVGVTATPNLLMNLRVNSMETARSIAMDFNSTLNPEIVGYDNIKKVNTLLNRELMPYDATRLNDIAQKAGVAATSLEYAYALNPEATKIRAGNGEQGIKENQLQNAHLSYVTSTQQLTKDYKAGLIGWDDWGNGVLGKKENFKDNVDTIEGKDGATNYKGDSGNSGNASGLSPSSPTTGTGTQTGGSMSGGQRNVSGSGNVGVGVGGGISSGMNSGGWGDFGAW